jgi:hypothetical protein
MSIEKGRGRDLWLSFIEDTALAEIACKKLLLALELSGFELVRQRRSSNIVN